jgi:hypothetical protein
MYNLDFTLNFHKKLKKIKLLNKKLFMKISKILEVLQE